MIPVYNSADMRAMDAEAIASGIASTALMDAAAAGLARVLYRALGGVTGRHVTIFAGAGNNGGDGFALASILVSHKCAVRVIYTGEDHAPTADCAFMRRRFEEAGGKVEAFSPSCLRGADAAVDAMFGIGFRGRLSGASLESAKAINAFQGFVIAADIPSGVYSDYGGMCEDAVAADATVCFSFPKPSCLLLPAAANCGQIFVEDIGVPSAVNAKFTPMFHMLDRACLSLLPKRSRTAYKNLHGHALVIAGSARYAGAPYLASAAALRTGAGLVSCAVPALIYNPVAAKLSSAMPCRMPDIEALGADSLYELLNLAAQSSAVLIGPGLGRAEATETLVRDLLTMLNVPIVLDADGINALEGHIDILSNMPIKPILTPHDGEYARLFGEKPPTDGRARMMAASAAAKKTGCVLVLKGYRTIVASPDERTYVNPTGNPGLAKGGSGDVLAGIVLSFLAQHASPFDAACAAVWLHGAAADAAARRLSEYAMLPEDLLSELAPLLRSRDSQRYV